MGKVNYGLFVLIMFSLLLVGCIGAESDSIPMQEQIRLRIESISKVGKLSGHHISGHKNRIQDITVENGEAVLKLIASPDFNADGVLSLAIDRSALIFKALFQEERFATLNEVLIEWCYPVTNIKGHASLYPLVVIKLSRTTATTINWANFTTANLVSIADHYWENLNTEELVQ